MVKQSYLTTLIGFLTGSLFYLTIQKNILVVFLLGGVGYFIGQFIDIIEYNKNSNPLYSKKSLTQSIFRIDSIPEALVIYDTKTNVTSVHIDFKVEIKPQNFHLLVLKNFLEFEFKIIEDSNKTIISFTLDYPECNFNKLYNSNSTNADYIKKDIQEKSHEFQIALQKIIPGLILTPVRFPDLFGDENNNSNNFTPFNQENYTNSFGPEVKKEDLHSNYDKENNISIFDVVKNSLSELDSETLERIEEINRSEK